MTDSVHTSVLLKESIEALNLSSGKVFLDGTFGGGGHSREVRRICGDSVQIIGLDRDPRVKESNPNFDIHTTSFADIDKLDVHPDAILLDLGISSDQLETSGRGFTFRQDEPLDMRMSGEGISAADILNSFDESAIELILRGFGEEKYSYRIAKNIVRVRELKPFKTTFDLVEAVESVVPKNFKHRIHPATRTFQALRIAVNDELTHLEKGLKNCFKALRPHGRLAVVSFHSLEDRLVKIFMRDKAKEEVGGLITRKPITPTDEEVIENPRSRSAKLRILEKNV